MIRLRNVSFTYAGSERPALRNINFVVEKGEFVVVMGATDSGKTTLAKCLNRIVPSFQKGDLTGEIFIAGRSMRDETVADLAGTVGFVSQDFEAQLFATQAAQEIAFGLEQHGVGRNQIQRRVAAALAMVGLEGFERRDPATLSGGEKQRLAIAAVLALDPSILVLDEPTTDLDPQAKSQVFEILARLREQRRTIVLVEHEIEAAERADRLVLMANGTIVANDVPERILPEVDKLAALAVRPADLDRIARAAGVRERFKSIEEAAQRIRPLVRRGRKSEALPAPGETVIELDAVTHVYSGERRALDSVSLRIATGEFIALIGQNGSGKTTLAKHLNGLLHPTEGTVRLGGTDITKVPLATVARQVGYVFQNPDHQIFSETVYEEVAFGLRNFGVPPHEIESRVHHALKAVGLDRLENADPFLLPKGHRQQLAVASFLALEPRVLILDEPTTGLDYAEQCRMMEMLQALHARGLTLVMITHSPWVVAEYAQRGVLMKSGKIVFDGPLRELFTREELLSECHFTLPGITRVGLRLGVSALRLEELL